MKFWLTLIVSIILISAVLTWMGQKGGQSYGSNYPKAHTKAPRPTELPVAPPARILWHHNEKQSTQDAHVIEINGPESFVGQDSSVMLVFENIGASLLELSLIEVNCGCIHDVLVGLSPKELKKLELRKGPPMAFQPKQKGLVQVNWKPELKQLNAGATAKDHRFTFVLGTNDPQYPRVQMELKTRVSLPAESKP